MNDRDGAQTPSSNHPAGPGKAAARHGGRLRERSLPKALLGTAVLSGLLTGGVAATAGVMADRILHSGIDRNLTNAITVLRVAEGASRLASGATHLETAQTSLYRQSLYVGLRQQAQVIYGLSEQLQGVGSGPSGLSPFRRLGNGLEVSVEDLNSRAEQRITAEADLRGAAARVPERRALFHAAMATLRVPSAGDGKGAAERAAARDTLDEFGRSLADQLLVAVGHTQPARILESRRAFRQAASDLGAALNRLPIDLNSAHRAEAARQLIALGVDPGSIFDLAEERLALADSASEIARGIRNTATEVAANARRVAFAIQEAADENRIASAIGLAVGPLATGILTALFTFGGGLLAERWASRRTPSSTPWPAAIPADAEPNEVPPMHILLVEDEPFNQMIGAAMLRRAGHTVTVVGNGREALATMESGRFDLMLIDLRMPEMDGHEAVSRIRALPDPEQAGVRIIVLTASIVPEDSERCLAAGADAVLSKPLRLESLQPVLQRLLDEAPRPATAPASTAAAMPAEPPPDRDASPVFNQDAIQQMREYLPPARIASLVTGTTSTLRAYHETLEASWTSGDRDAVSAMAHKIAGVAGIYGCVALQRAAQALEAAIASGEAPPSCKQALDTALPPALTALKTQSAGLMEEAGA